MALIKACIVGNSAKNTGKECDTAMGPAAMFLSVPPNIVITPANLADPIGWITPLLHASKATRVRPFFGQAAPINSIKPENQSDVIITLDDGTQVLVRYGVYGRVFETIKGGLCYARALQSLGNSGFNNIEIDQTGQVMLKKKADGNFTALTTVFQYSPSPIMADGKSTVYTNRFQMSYQPLDMVQNGEIYTGGDVLLSLMGLIDATPFKAAAATTTKLKIGVKTICAESDLVALWGAALGTFANNFVVYDKADLTTPTVISAAAIVTGWIELTGAFTSGHTYRVYGAVPSQWLTNSVTGYDAEDYYVDILIP